jgi:hypothetical protein
MGHIKTTRGQLGHPLAQDSFRLLGGEGQYTLERTAATLRQLGQLEQLGRLG